MSNNNKIRKITNDNMTINKEHSDNNNTSNNKTNNSQYQNRNNYNHYYIIFYLFIISTCIKILLIPIYKSTDYNVHLHWKSITYYKNNIPLYNWYYDNTYLYNTIHTIDYPPSFILFFEYIWSNLYYPFVQLIINYYKQQIQVQQGITDTCTSSIKSSSSFDTCLNLYSDNDLLPTTSTSSNIAHNPLYDNQCILFMRSTVIISDIMLWIGSYIVSTAVVASSNSNQQQNINSKKVSSSSLFNKKVNFSYILFLLLTFNPGLYILDHIHFQYNGFLLGILLCSIGCLLHANKNNTTSAESTVKNTITASKLYHLSSAGIFAILITFKHLYITLGLWYVSYLFRRYCVKVTSSMDTKKIRNNNKKQLQQVQVQVQVQRIHYTNFFQLAIVTVSMIILPFIPFILSIVYANNNNYDNKSITTLVGLFQTIDTSTTRPSIIMLLKKFFIQMKERLFPFQRGLVHDYWAGNIWAILIAVQQYIIPILHKIIPNHKFLLTLQNNNVNDIIQPLHCLILLFIMLLPSTICAWIAGAGAGAASTSSNINNINDKHIRNNNSNSLLLLSLSHAAMTTFLFSYHVHEKAIMTAVVPIIIWTIVVSFNQFEETTTTTTTTSNSSSTSTSDNNNNHTTATTRKVFVIPVNNCWTFLWEFTSLSILGLFPLLYESRETLIKVTVYVSYLAAIHYCSIQFTTTIPKQEGGDSISIDNNNHNTIKKKKYNNNTRLTGCIIILTFVIIQLDFIPVQKLYGRYEFLPLAITSIVCSIGFILLYIQMTYYMIQLSRNFL